MVDELDAVGGDPAPLQREAGERLQARRLGIQASGGRSGKRALDKRHTAKLNLGTDRLPPAGVKPCDPCQRREDKKKPVLPLPCRVQVDGVDPGSSDRHRVKAPRRRRRPG